MTKISSIVNPAFISVIIPTYKAKRWFDRCFESLLSQTLEGCKFEIIFVFNGPDDGSLEYAKRIANAATTHNVKVIESNATNAAQARNEGLKHSTGTHVTWIDIDDLVSPNYLEALSLAVMPNTIPIAQLANVSPSGDVDRDNLINRDFLSKKELYVHPSSLPRSTTFMTAKLVPIAWARSNPMDENLRSGEDVAFYGKILSKYNFKLSLVPGLLNATYYRQLVSNSVSRGRTDRTFMVVERAEVINSLNRSLASCVTDNREIIKSYIRSQASFIKKYVNENLDERQDIFDYLSCFQFEFFPWQSFQDTPEDIAICYNFAPYSDTGANVASKRIRAIGKSTDVISADMSSARSLLEENLLLAKPYVARLKELKVPVTFSNPKGISDFVNAGLAAFENNLKSGRSYKRIYSRSMWPASHFLAAAIKHSYPTIEWTAEFSDPVRLTTTGEFRDAPIYMNELPEIFQRISNMDHSRALQDNEDLFSWTELLPYIAAEHLVFTNHQQLRTMLAYCPPVLKELVESKSSVSHHPTLPRRFYEISEHSNYNLDKGSPNSKETINIGYFGEFYSTRGLKEIVDALSELDVKYREKFTLHIFTSSKIPEQYSHLINSIIIVHEKCSYFRFLSILDSFQCVVVNDALTQKTHQRNPYLPSKYSDYRGSYAPIWALVEPGSTLDSLAVEYKTEIGDVKGASEVLSTLLEIHFTPISGLGI